MATIQDRIREHFADELTSPDATVGVKYAHTLSMKADDNGQVEAIINTADVDLDDEVVIPEGGNMAPLMRLKSIYYNHQYWELPIGTVRRVSIKDGAWRAVFGLTLRNQFAKDVWHLIQDEAINGTSIGFEALDRGVPTQDEVKQYGNVSSVVRTWNCFEFSVTPMPCNHGALIQRSASDEWLDRVERAVKSRRITAKSAAILGLDDRPTVKVGRPVVRVKL